MTRVLIVGAGGRMGDALLRAIAKSGELRLGAALERAGHPRLGAELAPGVKLGSDPRAACTQADVAVDFSSPESTLALLDAAEACGLPLVVGTTGRAPDGYEERFARAARRMPIVRAANFSIGVTVLLELVADAARRLAGYEIDVLEMHHDQKQDAPSGTALALGRAAATARGHDLQHVAVYAREGHTGVRDPAAIGLQTLRLGDSVGEHTVYFAGPGERLELSHRALSRDNFAAGALRAALWVIGRTPGLYTMGDVLR